MKIYNYNYLGLFIGCSDADENPLEPGRFLIPAGATEIEPLPGQRYFFNGTWSDQLRELTSKQLMEIELSEAAAKYKGRVLSIMRQFIDPFSPMREIYAPIS